eukprot:gene4955-6039_t
MDNMGAEADESQLESWVQQLSLPHPPSTRIAAAESMLRAMPSLNVHAIIQANAILPLLAMVQSVKRYGDFSPTPDNTADNLQMADAALLILAELSTEASVRLESAGWELKEDSSGQPSYFNYETSIMQRDPPKLAAEEGCWEAGVLLEMPTLIHPLSVANDGSAAWPVRVAHHVPRGSGGEAAVSVLDLAIPEGDGEEFSRQLVLGPWRGTNAPFEAEVATSDIHDCNLDSWQATTAIGMFLLSVAQASSTAPAASAARRPRVLLGGLRSGATAAFLARYAPQVRVHVVEPHGGVVQAAQQFFDLKCRKAGLAADATPLSVADLAGGEEDGVATVWSAWSFLERVEAAVFDAVLVDVADPVTGALPSFALSPSFFADLCRVSSPVNVAGGASAEEVQRLLRGELEAEGSSLGRVAVAMDETAEPSAPELLAASDPAPSDAAWQQRPYVQVPAYQTGVVVGVMGAGALHALSPGDWEEMEAELEAARRTAPAPPLPFKLECALAGHHGAMWVSWIENEVDAVAPAPVPETRSAVQTGGLWDLFGDTEDEEATGGSGELATAEYWAALSFRTLQVGGAAEAIAEEGPERATAEAAEVAAEVAHRAALQRHGYIMDSGDQAAFSIAERRDLARLVSGMCRLQEHGWPPIFIFMYDLTWKLVARLWRCAEALLESECVLEPSFAAFRLNAEKDSKGQRYVGNNFGLPHRDYSFADSVAPDGSLKLVSIWLPLNDVTLDNGCMYVVPHEFDPSSGNRHAFAPLPDEASWLLTNNATHLAFNFGIVSDLLLE